MVHHVQGFLDYVNIPVVEVGLSPKFSCLLAWTGSFLEHSAFVEMFAQAAISDRNLITPKHYVEESI